MYAISTEYRFSAAHRIRGHTRGCERTHGHNYRVRITLEAEELDELGMVMDFADVKALLKEILGPFDHRTINDIPPFERRNTTAELLSEYVYEELAGRLGDGRVRLARVEVWENERSCAAFAR